MDLSRPFATVTPTVDGSVLAVLASAEAAFTPGQVHQMAGAHSLSGVRKALARLVEQGTVDVERVGGAYVYALNRDHLAAPAVVELAGLRAAFLDRLRAEIAAWPQQPVYAALFGSAARGDMHLGSDIDVFVVRPDDLEGGPDHRGDRGDQAAGAEARRAAWDEQLSTLAWRGSRWTGNDTRLLELSETQARWDWAAGGVTTNIRRDGIQLAGSSTFWWHLTQ